MRSNDSGQGTHDGGSIGALSNSAGSDHWAMGGANAGDYSAVVVGGWGASPSEPSPPVFMGGVRVATGDPAGGGFFDSRFLTADDMVRDAAADRSGIGEGVDNISDFSALGTDGSVANSAQGGGGQGKVVFQDLHTTTSGTRSADTDAFALVIALNVQDDAAGGGAATSGMGYAVLTVGGVGSQQAADGASAHQFPWQVSTRAAYDAPHDPPGVDLIFG